MKTSFFVAAISAGMILTWAPVVWGAEPPASTEDTAEPPASTEDTAEPFAFADFSWLNGNSRQKTFPLHTEMFTGQFTLDTNYIYDFARPQDHTLVGSTNSGRTNEFQVQQLGVGGDFHHENVRGRFMTQFGMYSTMTPRNDASPQRGQWAMSDAFRYISEAYGGYHWDVWNGINLDAGIFMSYIGLCSYYNFDNWVYQMSYVSANTPWFFNGLRLQMFPNEKLKAELWLINGWQSYGMFNEQPGAGFSVQYRPTGDLAMVTNNYYGADTFGNPGRIRVHSDSSLQYKYLDTPAETISKAAFSVTLDLGCENGGGVSCMGGGGKPAQNFAGFMAYNRFWFNKDRYALTLGGGQIANPGRYLVLVPPSRGVDAYTGAGPEFPSSGDFRAWDSSMTFDYMPSEFITYRAEYNHREANTPYFAGPGGVTSTSGLMPADEDFTPDLVKREDRLNFSLMVRL